MAAILSGGDEFNSTSILASTDLLAVLCGVVVTVEMKAPGMQGNVVKSEYNKVSLLQKYN